MKTIQDYYILYNGVKMPCIAFGTNHMSGEVLENIMRTALRVGIRSFDTSYEYENEKETGHLLKQLGEELAIIRSDLFITSKIEIINQKKGDALDLLEKELEDLQTDYLDLWLLHWPAPDYYIETWNLMEEAYEAGKVRSIGICNASLRHITKMLSSNIKYRPMVVQNEISPINTYPELLPKLQKEGIQIETYSPLVRMVPLIRENIALKRLSTKYNVTISQLILRWCIQMNIIPIFRTSKEEHLIENCNLFHFSISTEDMRTIKAQNINWKYYLESVLCPGY